MKTFIFIFCLIAAVANAQIIGVVKDLHTQSPIAGANISLEDITHDRLHVQSSRMDGSFVFFILDSAAYLKITCLGYRDTSFAIGSIYSFEVFLQPQSVRGEEIIITAQRHITASQDVPVSVAVVKQEELALRSTLAVDQALRFIPGVSVTESQVNIRGSSGYGRGVGSRVLFLLDGMPLLSGDNGDIKFDIIPLIDIERIEIVKGAGSSLYGSSALGGVINVITREAADTPAAAISLIGGLNDQPSYSGWRVPLDGRSIISLEAAASRKINNIGILASIALRRNMGYRLGDDSYKQNGLVKVTTPLSTSMKLSSSLLYASENHGGWIYWKSLSKPLLPSDSLGAVNGRIHSEKANFQSSLSIVSESISHLVRGNIYYTSFLTDPTIPGGTPGPHSSAVNYTFEYNLNTDLAPFFITTGAIGNYQTVASDLFKDHHGVSLAYFAQAEWRLDDLILTFGVRADGIKYDSTAWMTQLSPKLGASFQLTDEIALRSSFGTGFRAPTISEKYIDQVFSGFPVKPNPTLEPERSSSVEIGGNYRSEHLYLDGAVFYSRFDQLIEPSFVGASIQFLNITQAEIFGHEEVVEVYPFGDDRLTARIGYTYVYPRNRVSGSVLQFRPRHLFQGRIASKFGDLTICSDFRYISAYETLDSVLVRSVPDGDARVDAYVLDANIGYDLHSALNIPFKATFEVQNLLNYYYVEIVGNLAPLRRFYLKLETVF